MHEQNSDLCELWARQNIDESVPTDEIKSSTQVDLNDEQSKS